MKRYLTLIITMFILQYSVNAQQNVEKIKTALLIIDIQDFYFPGDGPGLLNAEGTSKVAKEILQLFRDQDQMVIHIRHQSNSGFEIHKNVRPISDEKVITKNEINSFQGTDLLDYLKKNKVERLVIIGMQTQMCLEAVVRAGYDYGFECVVIQDACTTRDLKFGNKIIKAEDVHYSTLATIEGGGYGKVIDLDTFKGNMNQYLFQEITNE